jgi:DNA helicase-2/ATP-dependent DNA helicase PcrA
MTSIAPPTASGRGLPPDVSRSVDRPVLSPGELAAVLDLPIPTDEQQEVISSPLTPALVVAGAGSGKTETMAARVVYLVANGLVRPDQVLGLTFTRKAASGLAARIRRRLRALDAAGLGVPTGTDAALAEATEPTVSTYHAFAGRLIAEFGPLAGIGSSAQVLGPTATWQLARQVVGRWDGDLHSDRGAERVTEDLLSIAGALADHLAATEDLARELGAILEVLQAAPPSPRQRAERHSGLVDALKRLDERRAILPLIEAFTETKRRRGAVDFSDQMELAARLVQDSDRVGSILRQRFSVVLLDEYQDTGHAQRMILRALFGFPHGRGHPVTAVGDPVQSIYGWRGASASNLPRFATDFPAADGGPAGRMSLLTSFRNAQRVLDLANAASEPVRAAPVPVDRLRARPDAPAGDVRMGVFDRVDEEDAWLASLIAERWAAADSPPSTAVLVRRRADMAGIAAALRAAGLPVEVVGVGGLIDEPEVADLIATLRVVVDHDAGPSAVRLLLGPRWRLGLADLAALARRGRELGRPAKGTHPVGGDPGLPPAGAADAARSALDAAVASAVHAADGMVGLVDAVLDPGPATGYSESGFRRITQFGAELRLLRSRLGASLAELVADIERTTGTDIEALLRDGGRVHLDAFGAVVDELAAAGCGPVELLDYLAAADEREDGLAPGVVDPAPGRVQVLTVHAAKGLEWEIVALPHLCAGVFPSARTTTWLGEAGRLPPAVRGDRDDLPELQLPVGGDQSEMVKALAEHVDELKCAQLAEERRLMYVGLTRAQEVLLLSAHHWGASGLRPRGPGEFFAELRDLPASGVLEADAPNPPAGATNPMMADPRTAHWPSDPLGPRRAAVESAAAAVERHLAAMGSTSAAAAVATHDPRGWLQDVETLLAERTATREASSVILPEAFSVSALVELTADPEGLMARLRRPLPQAPMPQARRGSAFHAWLQRRYQGEGLIDIDDLPGADERDGVPDQHLSDLIEAFEHSTWAERTPSAIEVPFSTVIGGVLVRGRIDAVFPDSDGGATVVDWKTGAPPVGTAAEAAAVQLHAYRIAWSRLSGLPLGRVRAAFHYVAAGETMRPAPVDDSDAFEARIRGALDALREAMPSG